jgi:uncharacterized protein YutE (UPF0331/DUF86 family)
VVPTSPLEALERALGDLRGFVDEVPRQQFETDRRAFYMVRDALIMASQGAIDVALTLCRHHGLGLATEYRDAFRLLGEAGLLEAEIADELQGWAGLRNVLIHLYTKLDLDRLHHARTDGLDGLGRYLQAVAPLWAQLEEA